MFCAKIDFLSGLFEDTQSRGFYNGMLSIVSVKFSVNVDCVLFYRFRWNKKPVSDVFEVFRLFHVNMGSLLNPLKHNKRVVNLPKTAAESV